MEDLNKPNSSDPKIKTIESASVNDIDGIISVQNSRLVERDDLNETMSNTGMLLYQTSSEELRKVIEDEENHILLVEKEGDLVIGYALSYSLAKWIENKPDWKSNLRVDTDDISPDETLYLRQIAVLPGKEGGGVKLELKLFSLAKEQGYRFITGDILEAPIQNKISMDFHERIGFKKIGTVLDGGLVWAFMVKKLD